MDLHKKLKEKLQKNNLVSHIDQITACGNHGFTDLHFTKLSQRITNDSKYYIALNIDDNPIILYHPNLYNLKEEINDKMIKNNYFGGYDKKNNRVILHYESDGIFRIGNKHGPEKFLAQFDLCDFHLLAKRKNYKFFIECLPNKDKHRAIQILLCELGISLGFKTKVARNDLKPILSKNYSKDIKNNILKINDINLNHITESLSLNNIDLIDVLWLEKTTDRIIAAFEVERSKNYDSVLKRLSNISDPNTYLICVGSDYFNFKTTTLNAIYSTWFNSRRLNYLTLDSLFSMLEENKKYGSSLPFASVLNNNIIKIYK
ncbi:hypothetical protein [Clostridium chrysemydis]|uniref:hypothetical protein n=1 Tax=Clostridium chrysemydis TaxID=2665504 RepID=UPI001883FDB9|nr:hypothetical protein [Clostridium chrysemydis]